MKQTKRLTSSLKVGKMIEGALNTSITRNEANQKIDELVDVFNKQIVAMGTDLTSRIGASRANEIKQSELNLKRHIKNEIKNMNVKYDKIKNQDLIVFNTELGRMQEIMNDMDVNFDKKLENFKIHIESEIKKLQERVSENSLNLMFDTEIETLQTKIEKDIVKELDKLRVEMHKKISDDIDSKLIPIRGEIDSWRLLIDSLNTSLAKKALANKRDALSKTDISKLTPWWNERSYQ
ncbi:hypothetical protein QE152_g13192 [Popillia japonica]|uniref:Uncharacterized protein n=1 Tax=Popillia japonica TaxID=7064 RepID=A0AAW1LF36_POPJA